MGVHIVLEGAQVALSGPTGSYMGPKWAHRVLQGAQVGSIYPI